jgi:tRNA-Thr(GGU) m(6)t(6)A37 methyltransferase TsaA
MISFTPIGVVCTPYTELDATPRQTASAPDVEARVELDPRVRGAVRDLDGFSHLWLIVHLHEVDGWRPEIVPYFDSVTHGVLATRSPRRPNAIGLSLVELVEQRPEELGIRGIDLLDGTPVLDIKPYVPRFDSRSGASTGWFGDIGRE